MAPEYNIGQKTLIVANNVTTYITFGITSMRPVSAYNSAIFLAPTLTAQTRDLAVLLDLPRVSNLVFAVIVLTKFYNTSINHLLRMDEFGTIGFIQ